MELGNLERNIAISPFHTWNINHKMLYSVYHITYLKIFVQKRIFVYFCPFTFNGDVFQNIIGEEVVFYIKF